MSSNLSRRVVAPIVATVCTTIVVVAFVVGSFASSEVDYFGWEAAARKTELPSISVGYAKAQWFGLGIPLAVFLAGANLLRRSECSLESLVWYVCGTIGITALWLTYVFLAVYCIYLKFYR